ncbi:hypothetical protein HRbin33_01384 [bacterium HR33]|nr:hypothetical protein HRbin33_01384 [bacterium HR33]
MWVRRISCKRLWMQQLTGARAMLTELPTYPTARQINHGDMWITEAVSNKQQTIQD